MTNKASGYERDALDWYIEPEWCVELLLRSELFVGEVLDPAAGVGTIPRVCRRHGIEAHGFDLNPKSPDVTARDFLEGDVGIIDNIICNPPFKNAIPFIGKALEWTDLKVAMILPITFLASQIRKPIFEASPVSRIYILSRRPSMPPGNMVLKDGEAREGKGGSTDYCWIVWHHGHRGPPALEWLA